jgi:hypothetical protein
MAGEPARGTRLEDVPAGNVKPWAEVRDQLNAILRGWSAYFCYGDAGQGLQGDRSSRLRTRSALPQSAA